MSRSSPATFDSFLHADGGRLVDGQGRPVLLRGVGLGNWLLAEGYMWGFDRAGPQSARQIEALIGDLLGPVAAEAFWRAFRDRFIAEPDIRRIAAEGMDHVRLPINARLVIDDSGQLIDQGIALIDRLIDWCRTHRLWVLLDLHGAPGGQTGTNIDDSPRGLPDLFLEGGHYRDLTVSLWEALARRYRDETVIGGYDLLNEPLPNEYQERFAPELVALYRDLTDAIRGVDPNHLIIYEGTHWSTNWSIFTEVWDPNAMLEFHKYWSPPDRPSIRRFIETGERLGLPIYMGEGGENNLAWLQTAFQLYEDHQISWNLWPWKKIDTVTSPCSVPRPRAWEAILAYAAGGSRPSSSSIHSALSELLDGIRLENCEYRRGVLNAVMRRAPLRLPAIGFGFRGAGVSYHTSDSRPLADLRSDDAVTLRPKVAGASAFGNFHHSDGQPRAEDEQVVVVLDEGDWVAYEVEVRAPTRLRIRAAVSRNGDPATAAGWPELTLDNVTLDATLRDGALDALSPRIDLGIHTLRVSGRHPGTMLMWLDAEPVGSESPEVGPARR